jgi:hypothetical protein
MTALLLAAGCAALPHGEYRSGIYLHTHPAYSFQVPAGWHPAIGTREFAYVQRRLQWLNEEGRRQYLQREEGSFKEADAWLVSPQGAAIMVKHVPNMGTLRLPRGQKLTAREEQRLRERFGKNAPNATIETIELAEYGPQTGLRVTGVIEGVPMTMVLFVASGTGAVIAHFGTPDDDKEGFSDFEELANSFRFE